MNYKFKEPLLCSFIKREKRFFSYFKKEGEVLIAHCVNTGKMSDILVENSPSILSKKETGSLNYRWEAVNINNQWIGTNTGVPNQLVEGLLKSSLIPNLKEEIFKKEVSFMEEGQKYRADFASENIVVEVKNVHWVKENIAYFPDCVAARSSRQLDVLMALKKKGKRVIIIYILQRDDVELLSIDKKTDFLYYTKVEAAKETGVEFFAFNCNVTNANIKINREIKFFLK